MWSASRVLLLSVAMSCLALCAMGAKVSPNDLSILDYGADASGARDSTSAVQNALNAAKTKKVNVYVPPGKFIHNAQIRVDGVTLYGDGISSMIYATDQEQRAVNLLNIGSGVKRLWLSGVSQARKNAGWHTTLFVDHAKNFIVDQVTVAPQSGFYQYNAYDVFGIGGILMYYSSDGIVSNCEVRWTWADGIHMTGIASNITIINNLVHHNGDDGIPVVSYNPDQVHDVLIQNNTIHTLYWARGLSVIGGYRIRILDNTLYNLVGAAVWIAAEASFNTTVPRDIIVARNTATNVSNYLNACKNIGGAQTLPATGVDNGNSQYGTLDRVLFVDNKITNVCNQFIRTSGDPINEVVWAGNMFSNSVWYSGAELYSSNANFYSVGNTYAATIMNGVRGNAPLQGVFCANDRFLNIKPDRTPARAYYFGDSGVSVNRFEVWNSQLSSGSSAVSNFVVAPSVGTASYVAGVPNTSNQIVANKGQVPPTANSFTLDFARPSNNLLTISSTSFFNNMPNRASFTSLRLLAVYGVTGGGKADISFEHDVVTFSLTSTSIHYTLQYAVAGYNAAANNGVGVGTLTITIGSTSLSTTTTGPATTATTTTTGTSTPTTSFYIIGKHAANAGLVRVVEAGSTSGTDAKLGELANVAGRTWRLTSIGELRSVHNSNLCLETRGTNLNSGDVVGMWSCNGGANQKWTVGATSSTYGTITPQSKTSVCLDVRGPSTALYTPLQLWTCFGGSNQMWKLQNL
eukprot:TRINITY_DN24267_c0_g1_i1.p1 TRINITY_DN24267_c0_g1~~TRINITY_DN24267_c0_g1_i1.p1  ORF type:complete len:752 (-),score=171.08 TRINITY_DN24267_c0_g1_i1:61-2295(-)